MPSTSATVLPPEPAPPDVIHSCPSCSHWLPDGTLACPDCQTLTYGVYLSSVAAEAQQLEQEQKWPEARDRWRSALEWLPQDTRQAASIQAHIAQIDNRLQAEETQKAKWQKRLGPFAPVALFLLKIKSWLFLAFKLKFLLGIFAFFGIYWALFGPWFALGFTVIIFIHEMGHYVAVRRRGLKADLPIFFPGLGAYVRWYHLGVSREDLASISLAGPLFGLTAVLTCLFLNVMFPGHAGAVRGRYGDFFLVMANVGAWINLFNLVPLLGLDGAQATYALSRLQRAMIAATCLLFFAFTATGAQAGDLVGPNAQWVFVFIALGMGWRCFTNDAPEKPSTLTFAYFLGLIVALGFLLYLTIVPVSLLR